MTATQTDELVKIARREGIVRPRDLVGQGIARARLGELVTKGVLVRRGRGIYALSDGTEDAQASLAEACKHVPYGVICLLSALSFHGLTTQLPHEVWIAIHPKSHRPRLTYPPLRVVRFSGTALTEGVEEHTSRNGTIRVFSVAKTVVDCFRYRNKIGLDIALEALRDATRNKKATVDEIWKYASLLRQTTVIRPYLEAITSR